MQRASSATPSSNLLRRVLLLAVALAAAIPASAQVPVTAEILDDAPPIDPWMKAAGDLDGDGAVDIVVAGRDGPVVWYRAPLWDRHTIADTVSPGGSSTDIDLFDVDGDGDLDAVLANGIWHENPAPGGSATDEPWTTHVYGGRDGHDVHGSDLDGDGDIDLATRDQGAAGTTIYVYRNDLANGWLEIPVGPVPAGEGLALGDLDGDGDDDLAIADRWYENDGPLAAGAWRERLFDGVVSPEPDTVVAIADLDRDGRADVVVTPSEKAGETDRIEWFRGPSDPRNGLWTRAALSETVSSTHHSLQIVDWDLDGDLDVATARMQQAEDPVVEVLLNDGSPALWPVDVVDTVSSHDLVAADVDEDGDVDLIGADWKSSSALDGAPLRLWRNELPEPGAVPSLLAGAAALVWLRSRSRTRAGRLS